MIKQIQTVWKYYRSLQTSSKTLEIYPIKNKTKNKYNAVADPGFPVGGVDLRHGCFLVKMYAKTKELGPMRGRRVPGTPPRSANAMFALPHV